MHVAIVGKRNAGKSTLVNAIASLYEGDPNRVIVSEVPGTTRDSVDVRFEKDGQTLVVIDTAGVRKKTPYGRRRYFVLQFSPRRALHPPRGCGAAADRRHRTRERTGQKISQVHLPNNLSP